MTIKLPCYNIVVTLANGGGTITSDLTGEGNPKLAAAIDAMESLILAHACAGVDIADLTYIEGIETAVETCYTQMSQ
jgi:hypothetical protein